MTAHEAVAPGPDQPVKVRFLQAHLPYNAGEVAGFVPAVAANLIERRVAEPVRDAAPRAGAEGDGGGDQGQGGQGAGAQDRAPELDPRTHELTVDAVGELAETISDPAELARLVAGEQAHPKHPGGRKTALEYLELRAAELAPKE
jgi:hypothetical protein